jgi:hypothetical protein
MTKRITEDGANDKLGPDVAHRDPENRYPSGKSNALAGNKIDTNTDWDRVTSNPTQFGSGGQLRDFMLSKMDERPKTGAERPNLDSGIGYDNFDRSKKTNAETSDARLQRLRDAASGKGHLDYDYDQKGNPVNPKAGGQKQAT